MEQCTACDKPITVDGSTFCTRCGALVTDEPCNFCKTIMQKGDRYCMRCGRGVSDAPAHTRRNYIVEDG